MDPKDSEPRETILLTAGEAARRLSLAKSTVYVLIASRRLPAVRIGRAVRVPAHQLAKWVEQHSIS